MRRRNHVDRSSADRAITVSLSRRRAFRWLALPTASLLVPSFAWCAAGRVTSARLWPAQEYTRVILEGPAPIAHQLAVLKDPDRIVLDVEAAEISPDLSQLPARIAPSDPYIAGIRIGQKSAGTIRIVFDLKVPVEPQIFALAPVADFGHRVVLDLYPQTPVDPLMALVDESRAAPAATAKGSEATRAPQSGARGPNPTDRKSQSRRPVVVTIDPGHGGEDPGAIGPRGTYEKDVALAIARKLKTMIDRDRDMRAVLTRDDDFFVPLASRVQKARHVEADLFVSVHADAFKVPTARGSSVFALSEHGATSAAASWLAQKENAADLIGGVNIDARDPILARTLLDLSQAAQINDSLKAGRQVLDGIGSVNSLHKAVVEQAGFAVLKAPDIPSILVETAFISNPDEELKLRSDGYQSKLAGSMHEGIRRYFAQNPPLARGRTGTG